MRAFVPVALAAAVLAAGCGGAAGESGGGAGQEPKLETTDAGTRIITAIDQRAGLRIEVQDDSL
jgi:hypothetical protein